MKILVVEPHPDDAFLSLGWHLEKVWAGDEKTILTVYADERRDKEAKAYADAVGAGHICLGLSESKMDSPTTSIKAIPELRSKLHELEAEGYDLILFPLGLQHPDHIRVAVSRPPDAARYVDTPYQTKQKLADTLLSKTKGMVIESVLYPPKRKWRHGTLFKSQSLFFHYNAGLGDSLLPEMVLSPVPTSVSDP